MIEFVDVSKEYPGEAVAVRDFSLQIPAHQTTVFVGSSGCGKTTLLRMINRMVEPSSGQVTIDGENIREKDPVRLRRGIGYVLQNAGLLPHLRVIDNVACVLRLGGVAKHEARQRGEEMMAAVGLDPALAGRYPGQLSGGQQQRVGVARALAADPNILLMDEPFGAVDPIVRSELQDEVARLQRDLRKTIVFVTHDIDEAFRLGDQIVILQAEGQIAQVGSPAQILASPASDFVADFVGLKRGSRALYPRETEQGTVLVDGAGRPQGRLIKAAEADAARETGVGE